MALYAVRENWIFSLVQLKSNRTSLLLIELRHVDNEKICSSASIFTYFLDDGLNSSTFEVSLKSDVAV